LINPNGVTFTADAQVNVGGLVASTLNIKTEDFMNGHYSFEGLSSSAIVNQGNIKAGPQGTIALIAANIINEGTIDAEGGNVLFGAGSKVKLDLGGPVKLEVEKGALETKIDQGGAIRAAGGQVFLTAKAACELATSVMEISGTGAVSTGGNSRSKPLAINSTMSPAFNGAVASMRAVRF
jgi:large exoprotein involved in heme utilization and adhesion